MKPRITTHIGMRTERKNTKLCWWGGGEDLGGAGGEERI